MITRRDFLASGLTAAAAGVIVPPVFAKSVFAAGADGVHSDRVLVILQMAGGNDGLNTVVPIADSAYFDARPTLRVTPDATLPLTPAYGLNPAMPGLKKLFDDGAVAIVQGVGYENPTYSHFENLYVWEYADPTRRQRDGWLGTLLERQLGPLGHPLSACALGETSVPPELSDPGVAVSVVESAEAYQVRGGAAQQAQVTSLYRRTPGIYGVLVDQALATAEGGIASIRESASRYAPAVPYTKAGSSATTTLATSLQLTAELIVTQPTVKVCHVALGGFDTHQDEVARQTALLGDVDFAVSAFMQDLAAHGHGDRVVLMTWSEFGRRVAENGSGGTDHGAAAPLFVIGRAVAGGMYGEPPSLTNTIDSGNLEHTVDFRSVYQTLIRDWLQADSQAVLGANYSEMPFISKA